jgi:pyridoxamine 5'-phosphate oxidase
LAGTLLLIDWIETTHQNLRAIAWRELSAAARIQFAWTPPSELLTDMSLKADLADPEVLAPTDPLIPLENFCLLLPEPSRVDNLEPCFNS